MRQLYSLKHYYKNSITYDIYLKKHIMRKYKHNFTVNISFKIKYSRISYNESQEGGHIFRCKEFF